MSSVSPPTPQPAPAFPTSVPISSNPTFTPSIVSPPRLETLSEHESNGTDSARFHSGDCILSGRCGLSSTGVGIWCAIPFTAASVLTFRLVHKHNRSRLWATRALIAQLVLLVFTFILIGIAGNYVQTFGYVYSSYYSPDADSSLGSFTTKYHIIQAQLAFGILLMFSGLFYVGLYAYVTFVALWQPFHTLDIPHLFRE